MRSSVHSTVREPGFKPALREDLEFYRGDGSTVLIFDPLRQRRYQLYEVEGIIAKAMDGTRDLAAITQLAKKHVALATREQVTKVVTQIAGMGLLSNVAIELWSEPPPPRKQSDKGPAGKKGLFQPNLADADEPTVIQPMITAMKGGPAALAQGSPLPEFDHPQDWGSGESTDTAQTGGDPTALGGPGGEPTALGGPGGEPTTIGGAGGEPTAIGGPAGGARAAIASIAADNGPAAGDDDDDPDGAPTGNYRPEEVDAHIAAQAQSGGQGEVMASAPRPPISAPEPTPPPEPVYASSPASIPPAEVAGGEAWEIETPPWYADKKKRKLAYLGGVVVVFVALAIIPYPLYVTEKCIILAGERADVRAPVDGLLAEIFVEEGDIVKKGQKLARLDDRDVVHALAQAKAKVDSLEAKLAMLRGGSRPEEIRSARALVSARSRDVRFASRNAKRQRMLHRRGLASTADRDEAVRDLQVKQAALAQARAKLKLVQSGARPEAIDMAEADLRAAQAEVDYQTRKQALLVLKSPIAGRVFTPNFRERLYEKVTAGELVCEVGDAEIVRVEILVPEQYADVVEIGQPIEVKVSSYPTKSFSGEVAFIAPAVEEKEGQRFLRVEAELANKEGLLQPHMTGYAEIDTGNRSILSLLSRRVVRWVRVRFLI